MNELLLKEQRAKVDLLVAKLEIEKRKLVKMENENIETNCKTCDGFRYIFRDNYIIGLPDIPCPDCNPLGKY